MSPLRTCDDLRPLLGGYVLDALEPDETEAVREHLPDCAACAAEHASLAGLPALLDLAAPLDMPDEPLSPAFEEAVLDRFARDRESLRAQQQPKRRRRLPRIALTRPRVAIGSALVAAAISVAVTLGLDKSPTRPPMRTFMLPLTASANEPTARAHVALYRVHGGTGAHLWASGLRPGPGRVYEVLCEGKGWSASAGTFRADARGHVEVRLTTAARVGEYQRIRIVYRTKGHRTQDAFSGRLF